MRPCNAEIIERRRIRRIAEPIPVPQIETQPVHVPEQVPVESPELVPVQVR